MKMTGTDALIVVDVQNDFCAEGALEVPDGDAVVEPINSIMPVFEHVFGTLDWHPPNHSSFKEQGGPWPVHCVAGTPGAETHPDLDTGPITFVKKGMKVEIDGYSGFVDSDLEEQLRSAGVERVFVTGLATDYCVKHTALHALESDFETVILTDACRSVEVTAGDGEAALSDIVEAGGTLATTGDIES